MNPTLRRWAPFGLIFLAIGLATAMAGPFLTLFLTDAVHAGPLHVTAFLVAAPLSSVLLSTVIGQWSDRLPSRRPLIIGAGLVGSAGSLLTAVLRDYWILLALTVTATAAAASILPQLFAYARTALLGSDRAAMTMSTLRTLFSISWVAGPFLATVLIAAGGFKASYGFAAAMYAIAAVIAWRVLPDQPSLLAGPPPVVAVDPETGVSAYGESSSITDQPDAPRRVLVMTVAALVLLQCAGNLGVQSMALFVSGDLHGGIGDAGLIMGLCAGLEVPLMLGFGALTTRVRLRRLILAGPACTFAYGLVVASSTHVWQVAAAQIFNASAVALLQGLGVTYVQEMLPRHPGRASTLFTNAFPAGSMLAGPILGFAARYGYRMSYATAAVLAVVAFVLVLLARPSRRSAPPARALVDVSAGLSASAQTEDVAEAGDFDSFAHGR